MTHTSSFTPTQIAQFPKLTAWLDALRSGKYNQTTRRLRRSTGFCCMGVACDLENPNGWRLITYDWEHDVYKFEDSSHKFEMTVSLPPSISASYAAELGTTKYRVNAIVGRAIAKNDKGSTFFVIANYLQNAFHQINSEFPVR